MADTRTKQSESAWVRTVLPVFESIAGAMSQKRMQLKVEAGKRLRYAHEVVRYKQEGPSQIHEAGYQTDLLLYDLFEDGAWAPRVVVECKAGHVSTHDALTYSTKAASHKQVHPYLRYGILIGNYGETLPARLMRHGAFFDFMAVWKDRSPDPVELTRLTDVVPQEVQASRQLELLLTNRKRDRRTYCLLHRPLVLKSSTLNQSE